MSKVHILSILEIIELFRTNGKVSIFSSAHFRRTLESTLSVRHGMMTLLNKVICLNIFVLICLNIFVKNCPNIFGQKLCKYFWSKIVQIFLVKCANIFGQNIWKNFAKIFGRKPPENQQRTGESKSILHDKYVDTSTVGM